MTVSPPAVAELPPPVLWPLPDPPRRKPDELMANFKHLTINGCALHLARHFGHPETTLLGGDLYLAPFPPTDMTGIRYPDLLIAFNVDPEAYDRHNAYIISEQGKPPDFILEIGSPSTGRVDVEEKRDDYAALGVPEYWRFDETGRSHGTRLAGDRLVDGIYQPIAVVELEEDVLQGRSAVLHLDLRWEHGRLHWHDPATGVHITTYDDQEARAERNRALADEANARAARDRARADKADARADKADARADKANARAEGESVRADKADARADKAEAAARAAAEQIRALEAQLRRRDSQQE